MSTTERRGPVKAAITVSLDGYVTGPDDRAGQGARRRRGALRPPGGDAR